MCLERGGRFWLFGWDRFGCWRRGGDRFWLWEEVGVGFGCGGRGWGMG